MRIDSVLQNYLARHHTTVINEDHHSQTQQPKTSAASTPDKKKIQSGLDLIERLDNLRKKEAISNTDYEALKAKILAMLE